jgi:hypothetical protein
MHLTALKKLKTLKLGALPAGCADELTTDLLSKLPELASLSLHCAVFTSLRELSGLSTLTRLTKLQLTGWGRDAKMRMRTFRCYGHCVSCVTWQLIYLGAVVVTCCRDLRQACQTLRDWIISAAHTGFDW